MQAMQDSCLESIAPAAGKTPPVLEGKSALETSPCRGAADRDRLCRRKAAKICSRRCKSYSRPAPYIHAARRTDRFGSAFSPRIGGNRKLADGVLIASMIGSNQTRSTRAPFL